MKKTLICLIALGLSIVGLVYAAVDLNEINFTNVQAGNFDQRLRGWFGTINQDIVRANGFNGVLSGGTVYYVDGNKSSAGNGTSWDDAFNTLSAAFTASHANIAVSSRRAWATRNSIFVIGDMIDEDITALAQKTDVIGVGSNDFAPKAGISGNWVIPATTNYQGCRFFNMDFSDTAAGGILFDLDGQAGIEFYNCTFDSAATDTIGLRLTSSNWIKVIGCDFGPVSGGGRGFSTAAIQTVQDDPMYQTRIVGNYISGAVGIDWNETTVNNILIDYNRFNVTTMFIDTDDTAGIMITNNMGITAAAEADGTSFDFDLAWAAWNVFTGNDETNVWPDITDWK